MVAMTGKEIESAKRRAVSGGSPRRGPRFLLLAVGAAALFLVCGASGYAQSGTINGNRTGVHNYPEDTGSILTPNGSDGIDSMQAEKRLNAMNEERQKALTADTAKLLKLATELNLEIAESNPGQLTPDQVRMVAEMEKLARSVREKMAMSLRGPGLPGSETVTPIFAPAPRP
jgi:hypothetical protein